jgi:hypothetical protein
MCSNRWQPYKFDGRMYFEIVEVTGFRPEAWSDIVNFDMDEIEVLWNRGRDKVDVDAELSKMPWGSYRLILQDPDGCQLGFAGKRLGGLPPAACAQRCQGRHKDLTHRFLDEK